MLRPTPGDSWGVEQHHWNTGAKEKKTTVEPNSLLNFCYIVSILQKLLIYLRVLNRTGSKMYMGKLKNR